MKSIASLAAAGALLAGFPAAALEAIPAYSVITASPAYAFGGAGFAFVPQTNLLVSALGCGGIGITNEPCRVAVWDTNGRQLASAVATTNSPFINQTHYRSIAPLYLAHGQTYYLSAVGTESGLWAGDEVSNSEGNSFSVAADLSYMGYATDTNSAGVFPKTVVNSLRLCIGPNFLYTVVSGPVIWLDQVQWRNGQTQVGFNLSGGALSSFSLLEAGQANGPWMTNSTARLTTNAPGLSYTFTAPASGPLRFYRVQSP